MAKCKRCGKKGLFLKVDGNGLCSGCQAVVEQEAQAARIKEQNEKQCAYYAERIASLRSELEDQESIFNEIKAEAEKAALKDIDEKVAAKNAELQALNKRLIDDNAACAEKAEELTKAEKSLTSAVNRAQKVKNLYKSMEYSISEYSRASAEQQGFYVPRAVEQLDELLQPTVELQLHCMDVRELRKRYNQNAKQIEDTLTKYESRYTTKANIAVYKLMVMALRAELQNVLFNLSFGKLENSENDIKSMTAKYLKIATDGNQSIAPTMVKFIGEVEYLFLEAVHIEYEYYVKKEQMKEEQRALREQMRQEAEERRQLEQQRKQVEREESKYKAEIENVVAQLKATQDDVKMRALQDRIAELQQQLQEVEQKKEDITRLQNGQAGYVYVISNLGSFGDDVFKVGMTRRLEPQERVDELGSASVPFPFDVHSFIFSENAVALENTMHKRLNEQRLNKVNLRKEFFKVSLDELEQLVAELEPSAEFKRTMLAEQYHQSLSIDVLPEQSSSAFYDDEADDEEEPL